MSEYDELEAQIASCSDSTPQPARPADSERYVTETEEPRLSQWATVGEGIYKPSGKTIPSIPAGVYTVGFDQNQNLVVIKTKVVTDNLIILPDTSGKRVLDSISHFWTCKPKFDERGQVFKRGVMLWGPPGSGKTATIMLLTKDLIERDGIVLYGTRPEITIAGIKAIRQVEPARPIICVLEDLDEIVSQYGEHAMLALLDGEMQTDNVVFLATTNYPDRLARRILNRPSRFDEVVKVGMPSDEARQVYLRSLLTPEELSDQELGKWVADTQGFSVAHLKELMVCVFCLSREYDETLKRLRSMDRALNGDDKRAIGFER